MKLIENGYLLEFPEELAFSDDKFFAFCKKNPELNIERDKYHNLIIMSPSGTLSEFFNGRIFLKLGIWNEKAGSGKLFGSSAGFILPDGSMRSPDIAWVSNEQWNKLTREEKMKFAPICPEFIVEVRSPSDSLKQVTDKMHEWMANGVKLAWLIDTEAQKTYIYRPGGEDVVEGFETHLSGENVLPGLELDLRILKED